MIFFWRKLKKRDPAREKLLRGFEKEIGYRFSDLNLLNTALTHPSYLNEKQIKDQADYERMEFLGDSVLGLVVSSFIYKKFPHYDEGGLSDIKSWVVSEKMLASVARRMRIGKYILLGSGEARSGGRRKNSILSNVFESVVGAIYLDGGFDKGRNFILKFFRHDIVSRPPNREANNFKGKLQKLTQNRFGADPHYAIIAEHGPSHSRMFEIEVSVTDRKLASGKGRSKKEAEQKAALAAIRLLQPAGSPDSSKNGTSRRNGRKSGGKKKTAPYSDSHTVSS